MEIEGDPIYREVIEVKTDGGLETAVSGILKISKSYLNTRIVDPFIVYYWIYIGLMVLFGMCALYSLIRLCFFESEEEKEIDNSIINKKKLE